MGPCRACAAARPEPVPAFRPRSTALPRVFVAALVFAVIMAIVGRRAGRHHHHDLLQRRHRRWNAGRVGDRGRARLRRRPVLGLRAGDPGRARRADRLLLPAAGRSPKAGAGRSSAFSRWSASANWVISLLGRLLAEIAPVASGVADVAAGLFFMALSAVLAAVGYYFPPRREGGRGDRRRGDGVRLN